MGAPPLHLPLRHQPAHLASPSLAHVRDRHDVGRDSQRSRRHDVFRRDAEIGQEIPFHVPVLFFDGGVDDRRGVRVAAHVED